MDSRLDPNGDSSGSADATVAFVDLVRFTSLTEVHGDIAGADAAEQLDELTRSLLGDRVRLVKALGDGMLLLAEDPVSALLCVAQIVEALHDLNDGSDARAGVDHGPLVQRKGDIFGSTVNVAARIVSVANPGMLVVTRPVARAAGGAGLVCSPLGLQRIRGFAEEVELFQIDPCEHGGHWLADPVCGMRVEAGSAIAAPGIDRGSIGFCSSACAERFAAAPQRYI